MKLINWIKQSPKEVFFHIHLPRQAHKTHPSCGRLEWDYILSWWQFVPVSSPCWFCSHEKLRSYGVIAVCTKVPKITYAKQCVLGLDFLWASSKSPLCDVVKVKPKLQWRPQDAGDAKVVGHLPIKAVEVGSTQERDCMLQRTEVRGETTHGCDSHMMLSFRCQRRSCRVQSLSLSP